MKKLSIVLATSMLFSSCYVTTVVSGKGGKSDGKPCTGCYDGKKKQWYLFGGLVNLDKDAPKDALNRAGINPEVPSNYTMRITQNFADLLICSITYGIACPKTIRVSKGN